MLIRRFALAGSALVLALVVAVPLALANPPVTVVLTNGQRVSGELVYHHDNNIAVKVNGQEQSYPQSQVAVIEFSSGSPSAQELSQVTAGSGELASNAIALKSGQVVQGKLYDISDDGSTLTVNTTANNRQNFSANDIARLYLHPSQAQSLLASNAAPGSVATTGQAPAAGAITVNANQAWTPAGITVRRGDRLVFQSSGQVHWGQGADQVAGPEGAANMVNPSAGYPVPTLGAGALIGRVGNGAPFAIGSSGQPITMPAAGQLFLGINDNQLGDNSGSFRVTISRQ